MSEAGRQLREIARELVKAGKKARRRGRPKDWHRLRTTSRRLRGALAAHADLLAPALRPKLARRAKQITKLPARVRDLDVALEHLRALRHGVATGAERHAAKELRRRLERRRTRHERVLRKRLGRERPARALAVSLRKALKHPVDRRHGEAGLSALAVGARSVLECRARVGEWDDPEKLHLLRVAVKKYRGALAAWAAAPGRVRDHRIALNELQAVLTVLGEHHDWSELCRRLDQRRLALAHDGARHRDLVGYEGLLARARKEEKARHEIYRAQFHDRLPILVAAGAARLRPRAVPSAMVLPPLVPAAVAPTHEAAPAVH
jgi:CHAD domain-containing protein